MKSIGLDIGTTTICAAVIDLSNGDVVKTLTKQNDSVIPGHSATERLQDPEHILEICLFLLNELFSEYTDITSVGISGQMHGILYVGGGKAKSPLITWQDGRGSLKSPEGVSYAQMLSEITGIAAATGYGLVTVLHDSQNGRIPSGADVICTIGDYVGMILCGNSSPLLHLSNAAGLGGFDTATGDFSANLPPGINQSLLPEIITGEAVIGRHRNASVCCAVGDNQASVFGSLGSGVSALVNIGTGGQISAISDMPVKYNCGLECRPYFGGKFLSVGASLCGGYAFHVLRDFFLEATTLLGTQPTDDLYMRMNKWAEQALKNQSRLKVDTRFQGTRSEPNLRGSITGIGTDNFNPGALCLGVLEGICSELQDLSSRINPPLVCGERLAASGGGVRDSAIVQSILADTFGMRVVVPVCNEEAAFGAALISSVAAGITDINQAGELIKYE